MYVKNIFPFQSPSIKILNWNIQNPSLRRAIKQVEWIINIKPNVIILTEAKDSNGCRFITDKLNSIGYDAHLPTVKDSDYCVIIASRGFNSKIEKLNVNFLPHRLLCLKCDTFLGEVIFVGIYVPSRGPREKRNVDKKKFQEEVIKAFNDLSKENMLKNYVICGDLNVIERNHIPSYTFFGEWEYTFYESFEKNRLIDVFKLLNPRLIEHSWVGRGGNGYRFDHIFVAEKLLKYVEGCSYVHEPRTYKLSDHSAMILNIKSDKI